MGGMRSLPNDSFSVPVGMSPRYQLKPMATPSPRPGRNVISGPPEMPVSNDSPGRLTPRDAPNATTDGQALASVAPPVRSGRNRRVTVLVVAAGATASADVTSRTPDTDRASVTACRISSSDCTTPVR